MNHRLLPALLSLALAACSPVLAASPVFLIRTGTDSSGNPAFRVATSADTSVQPLMSLAESSHAIQEVTRYYDAVQRDKLAASLAAQNATAEQQQTAIANAPTDPVFVEVANGSGGTYNDWKGTFSVTDAAGHTTTVSTPRVVYALGGDVARSGNTGLIEQTLVHEMGHGVMSKAYAGGQLPDSPYLSKPHSGGSTSDEQLSLIEGWAEFVGTYFTGRTTIAEDPAGAIQTNWYGKDASGQPKSAADLVKTEGWCATVMYEVSVAGKDQNALWKMTQVMERQSPQSTMDLLTRTAATYPELAPVVNQVLYQESGGQLGSASPAPAAGDGIDPSIVASPPAPAPAPASGGGSPALAAAEQAYRATQAQLAKVPWWKFWEKHRLSGQLAVIGGEYQRLLATSNVPAVDPGIELPQAPMNPVAPLAPGKSYRALVDAASHGDTAAARRSLEVLRQSFERRRDLRGGTPRSER